MDQHDPPLDPQTAVLLRRLSAAYQSHDPALAEVFVVLLGDAQAVSIWRLPWPEPVATTDTELGQLDAAGFLQWHRGLRRMQTFVLTAAGLAAAAQLAAEVIV